MLNYSKDNEGDIICNLSLDEHYYSQRNNEVDPNNTCNTTAMVQALEIAGYDFPKIFPQYRQPEDKLTHFIRTEKRVLDYWRIIDAANYAAWEKKKGGYYEPNEIHAVLSYGTNLFMGKKVTEFRDYYPIDSIVHEIMGNEKPCVMSGKFGNLNHIVTLVGCVIFSNIFRSKNKEEIKFSNVKYFIINDTYGFTGDYRSGKSGNNVLITPSRFLDEFKDLQCRTHKWCHVIL